MACYRVEVTDEARKEIRRLPGNMRQRVVRLLKSLQAEPFPNDYRAIDIEKAGLSLGPETKLGRIRIAAWRIVYVVDNDRQLVTVLAVRKRPPYQYEDLRTILRDT